MNSSDWTPLAISGPSPSHFSATSGVETLTASGTRAFWYTFREASRLVRTGCVYWRPVSLPAAPISPTKAEIRRRVDLERARTMPVTIDLSTNGETCIQWREGFHRGAETMREAILQTLLVHRSVSVIPAIKKLATDPLPVPRLTLPVGRRRK